MEKKQPNRKPNNIDCGRSRMANFTVYEQHFTLLEKIINDLEMAKKPEHIFNCDKSMVAMVRCTGKVVVSQKTNQAYSESKGTRDHMTVNACFPMWSCFTTARNFFWSI